MPLRFMSKTLVLFSLFAGFVAVAQGVTSASASSVLHESSSVVPEAHSGIGSFLLVIGLGLLLGMRHSTDADHVVAISTIVSRQRSIRGAAFIGSVWGLGHTVTIFLVGALIILFGVIIPPRVGLSMEFCVAVMLVVLGILNLTGVMQTLTKRYTPAALLDKKEGGFLQRSAGRYGIYHFVRPLVIGLVHGLAGSAAVALLVLSTIHDPFRATMYLLIFGLGTMIGMMLMTAMMAVPLAYAGKRSHKVGQYLGYASGMVSLCFGCFLMYQLGFSGGLFTGHPQWTPR
jgi:high-affinity nickel permease